MKQPKRVIKKIKRTKTMTATIKEGSDYLLYIKNSHKSGSKSSSRITKISKATSEAKPIKKRISKRTSKKLSSTIKSLPVSSIPTISVSNPPMNIPQNPINMNLPKKTNSRIGLPGGPVAGMIDIVFCCDTTGSMSSYLKKTKDVIKQIIEKVKHKVNDETIDLKFGFVAYRDHPPEELTYVIQSQNLCNETEILDFISKQEARGGGDEPEAVMDGLWDAAANISWRNPFGTPTLRYIIHIADAPPHGELYGDGNSLGEWKKTGCPCGITIEKIAHIINMSEIHYRLIKIGNNLEKMVEVFKKNIINYEEIPLNEASNLDIKVSDMIIRELLPDDPNSLMV